LADTIRAYAKINLHLEVLNRRDDGYHNIFSLLAGIALCDSVSLEEADLRPSREGGVNVAIRSLGGSYGHVIESMPPADNLVGKAALLFCREAGLSGSVSFAIEKNIPAGAGLGGGSSDAAAALRLLNQTAPSFDEEDLMALGSRVGSDVPYCLTGGFALCAGRGEIVHRLRGNLPYEVCLVDCGIHVDTGGAYRLLGRSVDYQSSNAQTIFEQLCVEALSSGSIEPVRGLLRNDFEDIVCGAYPAIAAARDRLKVCGAVYAAMTGSGSCVFGLFSSLDHIDAAREALRGSGRVIATRFVSNRMPAESAGTRRSTECIRDVTQ